MKELCPFCGKHRAHYLTHICEGCECHHTEVRIPGEPHIPPYYEAEQNPDCPVHGDDARIDALHGKGAAAALNAAIADGSIFGDDRPVYRVWHIPQVPMQPFHVNTPDPNTAKLVRDALAEYDLFQFENNIKPDYSNASGIERFEDGEWCEYEEKL